MASPTATDLHSHVHKLSPTEVELHVVVSWERVQKNLNDSFQKLGQRARVKGFRPGKAPGKVVRQLYGRKVRHDVALQLMQEGLLHGVSTHALPVVSQPELDGPELCEGEPFEFIAKMQVRPEIGTLDLERLEIEAADRDVPNESVDLAVNRLREEHVELRSVDDARGAEDGHVLKVSYTVTVDGDGPQETVPRKSLTVRLGEEGVKKEINQGLQNVRTGETRDILVALDRGDDAPPQEGPDDAQPETKHAEEAPKKAAGRHATFHFKVESVQERILPEVDDAFAQDLEYGSLLEMRLALRKQLEDETERYALEIEKRRLFEKLAETNAVPVPDALVQQEKKSLLGAAGALLQHGAFGSEKDVDEWLSGLDGRATQGVRIGLLLHALAAHTQTVVTEEEVEAHLASIADASGKHIAKVRAEHSGDRRERIKSQLLEEKLVAYLRQSAKFVPASAAAPKTGNAKSKTAAADLADADAALPVSSGAVSSGAVSAQAGPALGVQTSDASLPTADASRADS